MSSSFDPEHHKDVWGASANQPGQPDLYIDLRAISAQVWLSLMLVWGAKIMIAIMMAASFSIINPVAADVYISDFLPLPSTFENITMNAVINGGLGFATVLIPGVLWKFILSDEFVCNPKGYFLNQPIRVAVAGILAFTYVMLVLLEILALRARINSSIDTGPIAIVEKQPELLPMVVASIAMILGTILLGLASAALTKSIQKRFSKPIPR